MKFSLSLCCPAVNYEDRMSCTPYLSVAIEIKNGGLRVIKKVEKAARNLC